MNLRRLAGDAVFKLKDLSGAYKLQGSSGSLAVLMYHGLEEDPQKLAARPLDVHPQYCLDEILFFVKQGYQLISPAQLASVEDDGDYLMVSFDDGHLNIACYLSQWMRDYSMPITLAVCPELIETQTMFWWEEALARFELSKQASIRLSAENGVSVVTSYNEFSQLIDGCSNQQRLDLLSQLRQQTDDVNQAKLRASPFVHRNLDWAQLRALVDNPLCTLAAHSLGHEIATSLKPEELLANATTCREVLEERCEQQVVDYVYPSGRFDEKTDAVILDAGYQRFYGLSNAINAKGRLSGNITRIRGYGKGSQNLRYYAHVWQQRHSAESTTKIDDLSY